MGFGVGEGWACCFFRSLRLYLYLYLDRDRLGPSLFLRPSLRCPSPSLFLRVSLPQLAGRGLGLLICQVQSRLFRLYLRLPLCRTLRPCFRLAVGFGSWVGFGSCRNRRRLFRSLRLSFLRDRLGPPNRPCFRFAETGFGAWVSLFHRLAPLVGLGLPACRARRSRLCPILFLCPTGLGL